MYAQRILSSGSFGSAAALRPSSLQRSVRAVRSVRAAHTVRVVLRENNDSKIGKGLAGEIVSVKAGYMRNHLYQKKIAVYATPHNIKTYARDLEQSDEDIAALKLAEEEEKKASEGLKALTGAEINEHAILSGYLKGKVLKIKRQATDSESDKILKTGSVNELVIRKKLSSQMKLDLEEMEGLEIGEDVDLGVLGEFECNIVLSSGLKTPLNVSVVRR
ncbi:hypothetical protein TL16_g03717 [Triparma laevis f. inornata]|uniref:Ribosomal protein L9 domain-containing protein n=2 Tax=Triparma laevis TaxID=1534972 RepID=A0A9W6ZV36_9STRA|nr:hypothetical protein TrLO_g12680 [Triparma laevis f. longispina]GMH63448.1 hypothetical protein TL16_g03717 [Triparma laevis f. inornata]